MSTCIYKYIHLMTKNVKSILTKQNETKQQQKNKPVCIPAWMHFIGGAAIHEYIYSAVFPLIRCHYLISIYSNLLLSFGFDTFVVFIFRFFLLLLNAVCVCSCMHAYSLESNSFGIPFHVNSNCLLFLLHRFEFVKFYSN